jgi:oligoendopeptidase F
MEDSQSNFKDLQDELENLYNTINQNSIKLDPVFQQIIEENYWDLFDTNDGTRTK